ncbi:uncharacterized protein LOC124365259 isoform X2 [Homalodisca vitripennis]|uniref:uncharacterized protein LOC124365259 isoform X2 n=1 Tax=Homalodisca vitripennis TaxID=197043 RepID=UPI001EEAF7A9|nr:uncharacterized protein LOC124365259 isoform X2 [Homalodisca vitripennis]
MYYTTSRIQQPSYSTHKKQVAAIQRVQQASDRDGEKLSPINLSIREATLVQLPPLNWAHYYSTPTSMLVQNTGFTVMIHAKYEHEMPYISSGPLTDNYVFSQIHFHWGEHNETGSGHAVDGIRYPLEMHVIHLKKDYTTLGEALESKDGIAVMVHLFALREERNIQLDQLTAVLQFIQRCKCCARLCPTPLSEIVHPFTNDYFLYWGAVGSPKGQYRILWFISRNVLPISAQQLKEFRQLHDPEGELLLTNSSKPQPLSGRSLFLVSPSERTNVTMYGVSRQAVQSEIYLESDESIDIRNAEYKSLAALEDNEYENCKVCPIPKRTKHAANINVGRPFKVNEGDTSVEESCIDLGNSADDSRVTVKTEMKYKDNSKRQKVITNVNVTTCKHNCKARYSPSEAVYSIVSTRGSELHLKRKSNLVRQADRSVEQACMLLSGRSSVHPTYSAPSLTSTGGYLTVKQEHTNLSGPPITNFSSELAVTNRDSDFVVKKEGKQKPYRDQINTIYNPNMDEYEYETIHEEISKSAKKGKKVTIKRFEGPDGRYNTNKKNGQYDPIRDNLWTENQKASITPKQDTSAHHSQSNTKLKGCDRYYMNEEEKEISREDTQRKHFLVHQIQKTTPYYKVVGQIPTLKEYQPDVVQNYPNYNNDNNKNKYTGQALLKTDENDLKTTKQQRVNDHIKPAYQGFYQNEYYTEKDHVEKTKKELYSKENIPFYPVPTSHDTGNYVLNPRKENKRPQQREDEDDPHCRVSLVVRTIVSDHRKPGYKKKGSKIPKYIVTKISPAEKKNYIEPTKTSLDIKQCYGEKQTPEVMENVYYAKPINEENKKDSNSNSEDIHSLQSFMDDYYENYMEKEHKESKKTQVVIKKHQNVKSNNTQQLHPNLKRNGSKQLPPSQDVQLQKPLSNEAETQNKLVNPDTTGNFENVTKKKSGAIYHKEIKDSNLTQKINVYHGKKEPDEDLHIIENTITGTVGKSQSTEVLFQSKQIEAISPHKNDTEKQINYNLVKSKHPEPQIYVKEPPNKTQPSTVICQNISLDQQIKGQAQIRHKVEYHDNKIMKTIDVSETNNNQKAQDNALQNNKLHGVEETYEESSNEQSSTYYKSKKQTFQQFQPVIQRYSVDNSNNPNINNVNKTDTEQNIQGTLKHNLLELNKTLVGAQTNSTERTSQVMDSSGFSKVTGIQKLTDTEVPPKSKLDYQCDKELVSHEYDQSNYNRYAYGKQSSRNNHIEHSKYKKNFKGQNQEIPEKSSEEHSDANNSFPKSSMPKQITRGVIENKTSPSTQVTGQKTDAVAYNPKKVLENNQNKCNNSEFEYEETLEEQNEVHTTKKVQGKTITTVRGRDEMYKLTSKTTSDKKLPLQEPMILDKVEIPGPRYVTRIPKPPLVEYEAYPVDPQQPYEIMTETLEEISSIVTTNKTFMMFKKINGKAVLNQPSAIESKQADTRSTKDQGEVSKPSNISNNRSTDEKGPEGVQDVNYTSKEHLSEEDNRKLIQRQQIQSSDTGTVISKKPEEKPINNGTEIQKQEKDRQMSNNLNQAPPDIFEKYEYSEISSISKQHYTSKEEKQVYKNLGFKGKKIVSMPEKEKHSQPLTPTDNNFPGVQDSNSYDINSEKSSERKIKIIVGSYMQQNSSLMLHALTPGHYGITAINQEEYKVAQDRKNNNNTNKFISEEYYESVKEDEKTKSNKKHYVAFSGLRHPSQPGSSNEYKIPSFEKPKDPIKQELKCPEIENEPTKDVSMNVVEPGPSEGGGMFQIVSLSEEYDSIKNKSQMLHQQFVQRVSPQQEDQNSPLVQPNSMPIDKNDGDIVIYIRQPRTKQEHLSPKITVDISDNHQMTAEELNAQKVQVHEIKNRNKKQKVLIQSINPRKSKSADVYRAPLTDSSEEDVITSSSDSNEKVLDTTHYNLTLKSTTKVNLEEGQNALVKSRAEVKIKPLNKQEAPSKTLLDQEFAQEPKTMVDECCSAFKITELHDSSSMRVTFLKNTSLPYLQGGPLLGDYIFHEVHFHWGMKDCCGTEHVIDGQRYAVEAHFLYFKKDYENLKTAMQYADGIAVVAIILTVGGPVNPHFAELVKDMPLLREANSGTYVSAESIFSWIRPTIDSAKGYYCYKGSLTNSPQYIDNAIWMVFPEPVLFCCQQSSEFRKLKSTKGDLLRKNYRPPKPLNNRTVYYVPTDRCAD